MAHRSKRARGGEGSPLVTEQYKIGKIANRCDVNSNPGRRVIFTDPTNPEHVVLMRSGPDHVWMLYKNLTGVYYVDPNMGGTGLTKSESKESAKQYPGFLKRYPILNSDTAAKAAGSPVSSLMSAGGMCDQIACAIAKVLIAHPEKDKFLRECTLKQLFVFSYDATDSCKVLMHTVKKTVADELLQGPVPKAYL